MSKAALITGGAKRIGRFIALELAKDGYSIAIHCNNSMSNAILTRDEIRGFGVDCEVFQCNFDDKKDVLYLFDNVLKRFPYLNVLINSASVFKRSNLRETTVDLFDETINVNLRSPFMLTRDFALKCKKGNIINIVDAKISNNNFSFFAYSLAKKSLEYLTYLSAKELAPDIRVNAIAPGLILPPDGDDSSYMEGLAKKTPLGKVGDIKDIVNGVFYLLNNDFITGEVLYIDGGGHL